MEITFEETRAHLGIQTQRQWSKAATTRTIPVLYDLFSLVCLMAYHLHRTSPITPHSTAWSTKAERPFPDRLTAVRLSLWLDSIAVGDRVGIRLDSHMQNANS